MEQNITCINCPMGCRMSVTVENGVVTAVRGNTCKRGEKYAQQECVAPERMVTAVLPVEGRKMPVSVKTRSPIPKKRSHTACSSSLWCTSPRLFARATLCLPMSAAAAWM